MLCYLLSCRAKNYYHMFSIKPRVVDVQQVVDRFNSLLCALSKTLFHNSSTSMEISGKPAMTKPNKSFNVFVEGNIGSGKTTFLSYFNSHHAVVHSEPTDIWRNVRGHNVLGMMYQDPARWAFTFQSLVQKTMVELHVKQSDKHPVKLMERSIYSARYCFVENLYKEGLMSAPEYAVLDEWFKWILSNIKLPGDLIVYLRTDPEVAYERIQQRGRKEESKLSLEYLTKLHKLHEDWLVDNKAFSTPVPVLVLDGNKTLPEVLKEFKNHEPEILKKISLKHEDEINTIDENSKSPIKIKNLLFSELIKPVIGL